MICEPHWTTWLTALLTPIVAILGIYIASRQWQTARNKLKFDLFEKRFAVYEASKSFLDSIASSGKVKDEELFKFLLATRQARWLLDVELANYLKMDIYKKATEIKMYESELEAMPVGAERSKNVQKQREIKIFLIDQYLILDEKLSPFLKLQH